MVENNIMHLDGYDFIAKKTDLEAPNAAAKPQPNFRRQHAQDADL